MKFVWQEDKNKILKQERNISFEQVVLAIENKQILDVMEHPNQSKYKGQKYLMIEINNYVYVVPAIIIDDEFHLITIYPSRKYTKKYLGGTK